MPRAPRHKKYKALIAPTLTEDDAFDNDQLIRRAQPAADEMVFCPVIKGGNRENYSKKSDFIDKYFRDCYN